MKHFPSRCRSAFVILFTLGSALLMNSAPRGLAADLVNVNFAANDRVKVGPAATGILTNDFWNNYTAPWQSFVVLTNLTAADGTPSGVPLTVQNGPGQWGFDFPDLMYNCYIYSQDFGDVILSLSNLTKGAYDLYLYGHAAADNGNTVFEVSVGNMNYGKLSTATNSDWSLTNWVEGAQYVVFRGVTVDDPSVPIVIDAHPGLSGYVLVNGLQIQASVPRAPGISVQPADTSVVIGQDATFSVSTFGTLPLSYQWSFNGTNIDGSTGASLILTNVQSAQAGQYSVTITNLLGSASSRNAVLTVTLPPDVIEVSGGTSLNGGPVSLPITLVANGNENALGFTLDYASTLLQFLSVTLGSNAASATLVVNDTHTNDGQVGVLIALPTGTAFPPGTQEVAVLSFSSALVNNQLMSPLVFGDMPVKRQLSDTAGNLLPVNFNEASVILPPVQYEADVSPRPAGDTEVSLVDWVLIGRFVAGLDSPTNATEFQRADCAPRQTGGDGLLTVADWVQAGRYAAGLDPLAPLGGPQAPIGLATHQSASKLISSSREISARVVPSADGQSCTVALSLAAIGNENAVGLSLNFDSWKLVFGTATLASGLSKASLQVNSTAAASGRLGFVLALPPGSTFAAGNAELLNISFKLAGPITSTMFSFGDQPVVRSVSDAQASELDSSFVIQSTAVAGRPSLSIARSKSSITLSWPTAAGNFVLQQTTNPAAGWSTVPTAATVVGSQNMLQITPGSNERFFRLAIP